LNRRRLKQIEKGRIKRLEFPQNARIITTQALIASITATIIAFDAGCSILLRENNTEMTIVTNITAAGAIIQGILSAISNKCCIFLLASLFSKSHH
jgi:hypothetical protein